MKKKWLLLAFLLTFLLPAAALGAPEVMKALFWQFGSDPAVAVLRGEHWGQILCGILLTAMPFAPLACFLLERAVLRGARRRRESAKPPELATAEERRAFYLRELEAERRAEPGTPWIAYAALCGLGVLVFGFGVLGVRLPGKIEETGRDLELYRAGTPAVYEGPLLLVDRPVRNGAKQVPDERYVYYHPAMAEDLRCAAALIAETQLMQPSYRVEYLPETGTILSITDGAGVLRTGGEGMELPTPAGCWLYGDLAVPICSQVEGYGALTREQKALGDPDKGHPVGRDLHDAALLPLRRPAHHAGRREVQAGHHEARQVHRLDRAAYFLRGTGPALLWPYPFSSKRESTHLWTTS